MRPVAFSVLSGLFLRRTLPVVVVLLSEVAAKGIVAGRDFNVPLDHGDSGYLRKRRKRKNTIENPDHLSGALQVGQPTSTLRTTAEHQAGGQPQPRGPPIGDGTAAGKDASSLLQKATTSSVVRRSKGELPVSSNKQLPVVPSPAPEEENVGLGERHNDNNPTSRGSSRRKEKTTTTSRTTLENGKKGNNKRDKLSFLHVGTKTNKNLVQERRGRTSFRSTTTQQEEQNYKDQNHDQRVAVEPLWEAASFVEDLCHGEKFAKTSLSSAGRESVYDKTQLSGPVFIGEELPVTLEAPHPVTSAACHAHLCLAFEPNRSFTERTFAAPEGADGSFLQLDHFSRRKARQADGPAPESSSSKGSGKGSGSKGSGEKGSGSKGSGGRASSGGIAPLEEGRTISTARTVLSESHDVQYRPHNQQFGPVVHGAGGTTTTAEKYKLAFDLAHTDAFKRFHVTHYREVSLDSHGAQELPGLACADHAEELANDLSWVKVAAGSPLEVFLKALNGLTVAGLAGHVLQEDQEGHHGHAKVEENFAKFFNAGALQWIAGAENTGHMHRILDLAAKVEAADSAEKSTKIMEEIDQTMLLASADATQESASLTMSIPMSSSSNTRTDAGGANQTNLSAENLAPQGGGTSSDTGNEVVDFLCSPCGLALLGASIIGVLGCAVLIYCSAFGFSGDRATVVEQPPAGDKQHKKKGAKDPKNKSSGTKPGGAATSPGGAGGGAPQPEGSGTKAAGGSSVQAGISQGERLSAAERSGGGSVTTHIVGQTNSGRIKTDALSVEETNNSSGGTAGRKVSRASQGFLQPPDFPEDGMDAVNSNNNSKGEPLKNRRSSEMNNKTGVNTSSGSVTAMKNKSAGSNAPKLASDLRSSHGSQVEVMGSASGSAAFPKSAGSGAPVYDQTERENLLEEDARGPPSSAAAQEPPETSSGGGEDEDSSDEESAAGKGPQKNKKGNTERLDFLKNRGNRGKPGKPPDKRKSATVDGGALKETPMPSLPSGAEYIPSSGNVGGNLPSGMQEL
ncbi:unnamed protein product [Amoebophrya sp. A120]|nr:unnamed protein product [Amoebophrya sp. A120]|eukprot:GSA120T00014857001.1